MPVRPRLIPGLLVLLSIALSESGCGGGGGGSHVSGLQVVDLAGQWNRVPAVQEDACAIASLLYLNAPTLMSVAQTDTSLLVEQHAPHGEFPAFAGTGTVSGNLVTITYDYRVDIDLGLSGHCDVDLHVVDAGTVSGDQIVGVVETTAAYDGNNVLACSYFDGCTVRAAFSASR